MLILKTFDLCKWGVELFLKSENNKKEKILEISDILNEISKILEDTADKIKKDEYPHGNCALLEKLSSSLILKLEKHLGKADLEDLDYSLSEASFVEKFYANRKDSEIVNNLYEASGKFRSISMTIKI